jgi:hypothetical protein
VPRADDIVLCANEASVLKKVLLGPSCLVPAAPLAERESVRRPEV